MKPLLGASVVLITGLTSVVGTTPAVAEHSGGGPCRGQSLARQSVDALVIGEQSQGSTKLILRADSDAGGSVRGKMILGRGLTRLEVTSWCRLWRGEPAGEILGSAVDARHGDVVHVLGEVILADGSKNLIKVDLTSEGRVRVRARLATGGHTEESHSTAAEDDSHGEWRSLTGDGWLTTTRWRLGSTKEGKRWFIK